MKENNVMKRMTFTAITLAIMAIVITFAISRSTIKAQNPNVDPHGFGIVGTWDVQTTMVDCTTGVPLSSGKSFVSYNQGGTYIEEASGVPSSRRYPGLGAWQHVRARTYSLAFKTFQYNADGTSNGKILVNLEVEHNLDDTTTSTAVARVYNAAGDLTATRCVNAVGTRFTGEN